ncbi:MAG: hypothetical protein SVU88_04940, partial [Candidatus Nanohaloarchaea archaeon]|nr:hypothetical protein [Candidatus Nanohaloarchaea archaeon]
MGDLSALLDRPWVASAEWTMERRGDPARRTAVLVGRSAVSVESPFQGDQRYSSRCRFSTFAASPAARSKASPSPAK